MSTSLWRGACWAAVAVSALLGGCGGGDSASAPVVNPSQPAIVLPPEAASVAAGQTASFSVGATGDGPLTYQWKRDGAEIAGANAASYTTPVLAATDDGATYTVSVSNAVGVATSDPVVLHVSAPPAAAGLTVTGPGEAAAGGDFIPQAPGIVTTSPTSCVELSGAQRCMSDMGISWSESQTESLSVILYSSDYAPPGEPPGVGVNGVNLTFSILFSDGFSLVCIRGVTADCDYATLGITLDTARRTLSFVDTPVPSARPGAPGIVLNGTIAY